MHEETPFEDLPESIRQEIVNHYNFMQHRTDQHAMAGEAYRHGIDMFLRSLKEEQMMGLKAVIDIIAGPGGTEAVGFFRGYTSILMEQYGFCAICGVKHEKVEDHLAKAAAEVSEELSEESLLNKFRVKNGRDGRVVCIKCGAVYQSLEDRMLRDPDDCHTCHLKTKWG